MVDSRAVLTQNTWRVIYLTVIFFSLALTFVVYLIAESLILEQRDLEARNSVQNEINLVGVKLQHSVDKINTVSAVIVSAIERNKNFSEADFADLVDDLLDMTPEMRHAAAAPGLVIRYVHPMEGNEAAIGLDYRDVTSQLIPIRQVIQTNQTVLAGPVDLVQGGQAFIGRSAAYIPSAASGGRYFWGIVSVVFDTERIYREIGLDQLSGLDTAIIKMTAGHGARDRVPYGREAVLEEDPVTVDVPVLDGIWRIAAVPHGGWSDYADELMDLRLRFAVGAAFLTIIALSVAKAFRQRSEARAQLFMAINSIEDGFAYFDSKDRLVLSNPKYREYYKESSPAIRYGATFESILRYGLERGQYMDAIGREEEWLKERLESHRSSNTVTEQKLGDGRWLRVLETQTPDGGIVGFRVDITELKNARDEAERANRAKSDFLNVMSHELRTPLAGISGYSAFIKAPERLISARALQNLLRKDTADVDALDRTFKGFLAEISAFGAKLDRSAKYLSRLINEVLDLSKIEAGKMSINEIETELDRFIGLIVSDFQMEASAKGLSLEFDGGTDGKMINVDPIRLRQILVNLIGNAVKFTDHGTVRVSTRLADDAIEIVVTDTGCGIPHQELSTIFDHFSQVDNSATRKAGGTGLGLAIARKIAELHGGTITAESQVDVGSVFTVRLPAN